MEILLLIGAIWLLIWIARHAYEVAFEPARHAPNPQAAPQSPLKRKGVYRPHPFVIAVADFARSVEYDSTGVSLRMGTDVWESARMKAGADDSVIGWYHSHPNLGAFFSGTDRRTQRAFFNHPHCVGLVIDPVRNEEKWFIGANSEELAAHQVLRHR